MIREKYYLYVLQSQKNGKYYVGITKDVEGRVNQHNRGAGKSTKSSKPWNLLYTEEFRSLSEASKRERYIKDQKSRLYLENMIKKNP
jgi:putative endonuclease